MMRSEPAEAGGRLITIVIPAFNEERNVLAVFEAVRLCLPGPEVLEIIFVDDGSSDATAESVRSLRVRDSSVRLIRFGRNSVSKRRSWRDWRPRRERPLLRSTATCSTPPSFSPRWSKLGAAGLR